MLNELTILGELMESPQSGYNLQSIMQRSFGRGKKISFGVLYPLLNKLEEANFISLENTDDARKKKIAHITEEGKKRFFDLMSTKIPEGSKYEEIFLVKLDVMQHLPLDEQEKLLSLFIQDQTMIVIKSKSTLSGLSDQSTIDHKYAKKKYELRLKKAQISIEWAEQFKNELSK